MRSGSKSRIGAINTYVLGLKYSDLKNVRDRNCSHGKKKYVQTSYFVFKVAPVT